MFNFGKLWIFKKISMVFICEFRRFDYLQRTTWAHKGSEMILHHFDRPDMETSKCCLRVYSFKTVNKILTSTIKWISWRQKGWRDNTGCSNMFWSSEMIACEASNVYEKIRKIYSAPWNCFFSLFGELQNQKWNF